ncbi:MAG: hypothetical protein JNK57_00550 [Planctomycetaceae bacterium]|nr:hypothetical protein [Planctomycetaceae bacterium]
MNNLNSRERTLLLLVLSFLPLGGLYYSWTTYQGMRSYRVEQILLAEEEKNRLHELSMTAMKELDRFDDAYNASSLPLSVADNTVSYQNFLSDLMLRNGLEAKTGSVKLDSVDYATTDRINKSVKEKAYDRIIISDTTATGSLDQLTNFLYDFYDLAMLHRIDSISVDLAAPDKEDETQLSIKFTVSAVILPSGPETKNWSEYLSGRLGKPRSAVNNLVVARNLFGPPNAAPKISSRASAEVEVGSNFSHRFTASDDNADDDLTFELVSSELDGFELAASDRGPTATLKGPRVTKAGRYRFNVRVSDNRLPLLTDEQVFTLTVAEPEPEVVREPAPPTPPRKYAPNTYITSLLQDRLGVATVVLNNRDKDELIHRNEGESFELDGKTWTVVKVDRRTVTLRVEDELLEFKIGSTLAEPQSTSKSVTTTESVSR